MLHPLRSVLVRPGRDRLVGTVEVDETYIGGEEAGLAGGRAPGKKQLTAVAVEVKEPNGIGRCRMALLADASAASLYVFVVTCPEFARQAGLCFVALEVKVRICRDEDHPLRMVADQLCCNGEPTPLPGRVVSEAELGLSALRPVP